ncbi:MAG: hypothetical protein AAF270_07720 [Pseudomonadota bacterium]
MSDAESILQALLNEVTAFAEQLLISQGAFAPFAAALDPQGLINGVEEDANAQDQTPQRIEHLRTLLAAHAATSDTIATALVYEVLIESPSDSDAVDGIVAELDHRSGYSLLVQIPFELDGDSIRYGELTAQPGEQAIFANSGATDDLDQTH